MIQGVIFDLGWTLMTYNGDWKQVSQVAYQDVAAFLNANRIYVGADFPAQFHAAREQGWKRAEETGIEQTVEDALRQVLGNLGYHSLDGIAARAVEIFFAHHEPHWVAYEDALATLQELTRRNLRLGLISNADDVGLVHRMVKRLGFAPYLSPVLSSAEAPRWRKPDPRIFHRVAQAWQIAPSAIVMVGDAPLYDVFGAHRAGMKAIWIDRNEGGDWQKIPKDRLNDPLVHAEAVVHTLAEIPPVIEKI